MSIEKRLIPSILIKDGDLVKTRKFRKPQYIGDPINTARIFNESEVDELVVFDINSSTKNFSINFDLIRDLASECFMPLTYGGGVNSLDDFDQLFNLGVEKISVGSLLHDDPKVVENAIHKYGAQSVVACVDIYKSFMKRSWQVSYRNNTRRSSLSLDQVLHRVTQIGVGEVIINNISADGTWSGFDAFIFSAIANKLHCPVVALGGGSSFKDAINFLTKTNVSASAFGSLSVYQQKDAGVLVSFPNYIERKALWKT